MLCKQTFKGFIEDKMTRIVLVETIGKKSTEVSKKCLGIRTGESIKKFFLWPCCIVTREENNNRKEESQVDFRFANFLSEDYAKIGFLFFAVLVIFLKRG